eukprot:TRINITY_DN420_c1_g3_i2.p1 TRINITY_DN420_c1_g3~~TRINITY_DN420_c1_g3_i2.p1  ORF type:complete len:363 (+),score=121.53 TRINITY_DN420_c1_g3_i2:57-1145(+)
MSDVSDTSSVQSEGSDVSIGDTSASAPEQKMGFWDRRSKRKAGEKRAQALKDWDTELARAVEIFEKLREPDHHYSINKNLLGCCTSVVIKHEGKASFLVAGGSWANAIVINRESDESNKWSAPVMIHVSGFQFGPSLGGVGSEQVSLCFNDALYRYVGGEKDGQTNKAVRVSCGVAAGPAAAGGDASSDVNVVTYAKGRGLYAGSTSESLHLNPRIQHNAAYYELETLDTELDITKVFKGEIKAPAARKWEETELYKILNGFPTKLDLEALIEKERLERIEQRKLQREKFIKDKQQRADDAKAVKDLAKKVETTKIEDDAAAPAAAAEEKKNEEDDLKSSEVLQMRVSREIKRIQTNPDLKV